MRRQLVQLHRIVAPERDTLRGLARERNFVSEEAYRYFQDVADHLARVEDSIETYRDVGAAAMDIYLSAQNNRMNEIMKQLTVVATIFMPLTLISGIYGMNVIKGMWPPFWRCGRSLRSSAPWWPSPWQCRPTSEGRTGGRAAQHGAGPPPESPDSAHDVYTVANIITLLRLILVPLFFAALVNGTNDTLSFLLFAIAASTDWVDGQIARRTGTVTELGKAIDPLVDRLLIAAAVVGLFLENRLPVWIVLVLLARDVYLLAGAWVLARSGAQRIQVAYIGKLTTALLLVGFGDLLLDWPVVPGLGIVDTPALPGLGGAPAALGIWFVYAGVVTSIATAVVYTIQARRRSTTRAATPSTGGKMKASSWRAAKARGFGPSRHCCPSPWSPS